MKYLLLILLFVINSYGYTTMYIYKNYDRYADTVNYNAGNDGFYIQASCPYYNYSYNLSLSFSFSSKNLSTNHVGYVGPVNLANIQGSVYQSSSVPIVLFNSLYHVSNSSYSTLSACQNFIASKSYSDLVAIMQNNTQKWLDTSNVPYTYFSFNESNFNSALSSFLYIQPPVDCNVFSRSDYTNLTGSVLKYMSNSATCENLVNKNDADGNKILSVSYADSKTCPGVICSYTPVSYFSCPQYNAAVNTVCQNRGCSGGVSNCVYSESDMVDVQASSYTCNCLNTVPKSPVDNNGSINQNYLNDNNNYVPPTQNSQNAIDDWNNNKTQLPSNNSQLNNSPTSYSIPDVTNSSNSNLDNVNNNLKDINNKMGFEVNSSLSQNNLNNKESGLLDKVLGFSPSDSVSGIGSDLNSSMIGVINSYTGYSNNAFGFVDSSQITYKEFTIDVFGKHFIIFSSKILTDYLDNYIVLIRSIFLFVMSVFGLVLIFKGDN